MDKSHWKCEFCGKKGHLRDGCFKLKAYREWWPGNKEDSAKRRNVVNTFKIEEQDTPLEGDWKYKGDLQG